MTIQSNNVIHAKKIVFNLLSFKKLILYLILLHLAGCASIDNMPYHDPNMDFTSIRTVAVMPFENLTNDKSASERVRDVFANMLLSTGEIYVLPPGEVARGASRAGISNPSVPSTDEIIKLANILKVDAVITGVLREYGETRSGATSGNIISLSLKMIEVQTGKIIWTASSTKGGISMKDRLLGGGGKPMNEVTAEAVYDIINELFH